MSRVPSVRTCVGCRERAAKSELLRVVAYGDGPTWSVQPDATSRRPGRGAHLHPDLACLDQAERRRAFPRAFRRSGAADTSALRSWLEKHRPAPPGAGTDENESGAAAHDSSMSLDR